MQRSKLNSSLTFQAVVLVLGVATVAASIGTCRAQEYLSGIEWPEPPVVTPGTPSLKGKLGTPPSDAVVLFDGTNFDAWKGAETWKIEDGAAVVGRNYIETKETFGDSQLHVEWSCPTPPKGTSQGRGNSGVFFGDYELQVLDSYENETYFDGQAGAIYKQQPPMVNAMRPPGQWNVYDIIWTAPRFDDSGKLKSPAYITVLHNGVVVQNHFELLGNTPFNQPPQYKPPTELPVRLQDHGNPVKFRNIWIRELKPIVGKRTREPFLRHDGKETPIEKKAASLGGDLKGRVTVLGQPVKSGKIDLYGLDGVKSRSAKISEGRYSFDASVAPGEYIVTLKSTGAEGPKIHQRYGMASISGLTMQHGPKDSEIDFDLSPPE